jgi:hypothetical protein
MIDAPDPKNMTRPLARCSECDTEVEHYNVFISPANEPKIVCWECMQRAEKGFISNRPYYRQARSHTIPR